MAQMHEEFIGRREEQKMLQQAAQSNEAHILVVYGRRRVGKTELIEHTLHKRNLIKIEGVEGLDHPSQMTRILYQLSKAFQNPHITRMKFDTWLELFDFIADHISEGEHTLYLEELQWLADYNDELISDLKYVWDNRLRKNPCLLLVLCGSSPSFMLNRVVHSKALYNRSIYEIHLQEFSLKEAVEFLSHRSQQEVMNAYLTVGGIPEYLKRIRNYSSLQIGICEESFKKNSFFRNEKKRIFISSFAQNIHYEKIIDFLSRVKFASKKEIESHLKIKSGGRLTEVLQDLESCGFIERYHPYQATKKSYLVRYCIADNYLRFYYKFIEPIAERIDKGDFTKTTASALNRDSYQKWLGFAFERFCRNQSQLIASIIGFSAVSYKSGVFFNRAATNRDKGFQIDLVFDRADHVLTICEIKYTQAKIGSEAIEHFERKLKLMPNPRKKRIEKILISASGATDSLLNQNYFDRVITLEELIEMALRSK